MVVAQFDGIVPYFEAFYIESLLYAAGRAVDAFGRFDQALTVENNSAMVVASVHEALTHTAAVSRFFWPSRKSNVAVARALKLRRAFGLDDSSPLANRELRDALEHYDERLDRFLLQDMVGFLFPGPMVASASLADDQLGKIFRLVDPVTEEFVLFGRTYPFGILRRTVENILQKVQGMRDQGARLDQAKKE